MNDRDYLERTIATVSSTALPALRALPRDMPLGDALDLLDRLRDAGREVGEAVLSNQTFRERPERSGDE